MRGRLALSVLLPFLACAVQWLLWDALKPYVWFLFFPAAFFSAWIGGLAGGLAATCISALLAWFVFIPPAFSFALDEPASAFFLVVFVVMGGLFAYIFERMRQAGRRTDEALASTEAAKAKISQLYRKTLELDALKNQFFANVSHELRTPLTLILAPLEDRHRRLASANSSAAELRETELMLRNARLLYRHVTDLLDVAKLDAGRMAVAWAGFDLARLARITASHFESLAAERRIDYRVSAPQTLQVEADSEKLQRVMLNLLSNAFKFTPDGGAVALRLSASDGQALIEVEDNGPGVAFELRAAVFERFRQGETGVQGRHGGTGLGLAIVKDFVELHGGSVALDAAPGGGALFSVRLGLAAPAGTVLGAPLAQDDMLDRQSVEELAVRAAPPDETREADLPLILVVEDNADMNEFIAATLRPYYRVASARDGREGLDKALALHPDLILSDVMMPLMGGEEMVKALRGAAVTRDLPIVVLTARADDELRMRLFALGVQDYLSKPFSGDELLARIGSLVAARRRTVAELSRSAERLRRLAEAVEKIAAVHDLPGLMAIVRHAVRELTGADGVTLVLRENGHCHYADEDAVGPLWKGQRFPLETCISGWAMLNRKAAVIEDIYADPRIPHAAYRPTFVKSLSMVPIGRENPVGAIGCYWAQRHLAGAEELELQQALADAMSVGLANLDLYRAMDAARLAAEQTAAILTEAQRLTGIGNWTWDIASGRHTWSPQIYRIYGRDPALPAAAYPEVSQYFTEESWAHLAGTVEQALAQGLAYECDAEVLRPDGSRRWITVRGEAMRDAAGNIVKLHGTVQDITARKLAEEQIRSLNAELEQRVVERTAELSAANQELDSFAYAVSHDLRAPLRAMSGFSRAVSEDYGAQLDGEAKVYLEQIDIASRKMGELIDGILALSRSTRGGLQRDEIDISALATCLLDELQRAEPGRRVSCTVQAGLRAVGDARMIEAVLRNLLSNAWKYSGKTAAAEIRVFSGEADGRRGFCVADNGAGFDMAHVGQLFQPFRRLHRQEEFPGTGIGLATVQRIIHRHGGEIRGEGRRGAGAVFCFTLPAGANEEKP
ncbi:MAG: response regulator [Rhodocyclales bacterium]|nr:response regulator [Rhodocyclales bacterium]